MKLFKVFFVIFLSFFSMHPAYPGGGLSTLKNEAQALEKRNISTPPRARATFPNYSYHQGEASQDHSERLCYNALVRISEKSPLAKKHFQFIFRSISSRSKEKPFIIADIGAGSGSIFALLSFFSGHDFLNYKPGSLRRLSLSLKLYEINEAFFKPLAEWMKLNAKEETSCCEWIQRDMTSPPEGEKADLLFFAHPNVENRSVDHMSSAGKKRIEDLSSWETIIKENLLQHLAPEGYALFFFQKKSEFDITYQWIQDLYNEKRFDFFLHAPLHLDSSHGKHSHFLCQYAIFIRSKK